MSAIADFFLSILYPLEWGVAWVMVQFHALLTAAGMDAVSGWTWSLSIVGLVVVLRILLIPLFVKQIKASRGMQLIQPEMRKIQKKYKGKTDPESRQAMSRESMELYKEHGTNPFASCLPALLQAPFFFALFRVLNSGIRNESGIGPLTPELAAQAGESSILGAQLTDTFVRTPGFAAKALTLTLIILMSATMFLTQRQLMMKNMPASALDNPFAQQQKILLYAFPVIFLVTGINFPLGVLVYWLTTNLWTGAQQFYVIRRMPAPGSLAEKALQERRRRKGLPDQTMTLKASAEDEPDAPAAPASGQRAQPKRKSRGPRPLGAGGTSTPAGGRPASGTPQPAPGTAPSSGGQAPVEGSAPDSSKGATPPRARGSETAPPKGSAPTKKSPAGSTASPGSKNPSSKNPAAKNPGTPGGSAASPGSAPPKNPKGSPGPGGKGGSRGGTGGGSRRGSPKGSGARR